jgi:hypothetical protein
MQSKKPSNVRRFVRRYVFCLPESNEQTQHPYRHGAQFDFAVGVDRTNSCKIQPFDHANMRRGHIGGAPTVLTPAIPYFTDCYEPLSQQAVYELLTEPELGKVNKAPVPAAKPKGGEVYVFVVDKNMPPADFIRQIHADQHRFKVNSSYKYRVSRK